MIRIIFKLLIGIILFDNYLCDFELTNDVNDLIEKKQWILQLIHTSDMHARFEETNADSDTCTQKDRIERKCYGGFARVAHVVRQWKQSKYPTLFLNAGDTFRGTALFYLYKWEIVAKFLNILNPDVINLGNHEFDYGVNGLLPFLKNVSFPVVVSNLDLSEQPEMAALIKKSIVFNINGKKVGIIGYVTSETRVIPIGGGVTITNEIESIKNEINRLKKEEGVNIFIGLGHSGYEFDKKVAAEIEDLDLIVGGHSHSFLSNDITADEEKPEGPYPTAVRHNNGKIVYIVHASKFTKYIGRLFITFDNDGNIVNIVGKPVLLNYKVPQAPDVLQELEMYRPELDKFYNMPIGYSRIYLMGEQKVCWKQECNLGNFITDSMIEYNSEHYTGHDGWTDAAIAVHNSASIRRSINKTSGEPITHSNIVDVLPLENIMGKIKLTGKQILEMLEHSVAEHKVGWENITYSGQFLQLSGLQVAYDLTRPVGERVLYEDGVFVRCARCFEPKYYKLQLNEVYTVIMHNYLYYGGNGYTMFKTEDSTWVSSEISIEQVLARYIEKIKYPIYAEVNNRVKFYTSPRIGCY